MVKSYIYGRVEKPAKATTTKKTKSSSEIDADEQAYNQFINKRNQDKLDEIYLQGLERMNQVQGEILEKAMKKHKSIGQKQLSPEEQDRLWKISMGKF